MRRSARCMSCARIQEGHLHQGDRRPASSRPRLRRRWSAAPRRRRRPRARGSSSLARATKTLREQTPIIAVADTGRPHDRPDAADPGTRALPTAELPHAGPEAAVAPSGPVRVRETASDGYRRTLATHQEVARPSRVDPGIAEAVERQTAPMRGAEPPLFGRNTPASTGRTGMERRRVGSRGWQAG